MRPQTPFTEKDKNNLRTLLNIAQSKADFQRVQCVWLRAEFAMDAATVAHITNLKSGTVRKIWSGFLKNGEQSLFCKKRGGRRNYYLSLEEEEKLLVPFLKKAETESIAIAAEVQLELEKITNSKVAKTTVYRLLARHGWRKKVLRQIPAERQKSTTSVELSEEKDQSKIHPIYI